ncbi:MAG TPA: glycosyltransferase family 39 protein, partial [Bryobacteraceae bacterium]|nr:glycosyltransferase family 39 protein [Bryobacteraceae bacterium]
MTPVSSPTQADGLARSSDRGEDIFSRNNTALILCAALCLLAWTPGLYRTFWADEAGTYWMARDGWREAIAHTSRWPGQSILYAVVTSFFCVGSPPLRDISMRTPSLLGSLVALFLLYRFAERIAGRGAGVVASAVFITHPSMIRSAVGARPYALAIAACIASFYCFYEWLQTGSRRY